MTSANKNRAMEVLGFLAALGFFGWVLAIQSGVTEAKAGVDSNAAAIQRERILEDQRHQETMTELRAIRSMLE